MKEILKLIKFNFLTAFPLASGGIIFSFVFLFLISLFFFPSAIGYVIFAGMSLVIPIQTIPEKSGFNKLYGILPVKRQSIIRANFFYIFSVHFVIEIICIILSFIALNLKLYKFAPLKESAIKMIEESFTLKSYFSEGLTIIVVIAFVSCLLFSYMEMMGQIFGRDNEMKIVLITLVAMTVLAIGFIKLGEHDIIPTFKITLPKTVLQKITSYICMNILMFVLEIIFSGITVKKLKNREL